MTQYLHVLIPARDQMIKWDTLKILEGVAYYMGERQLAVHIQATHWIVWARHKLVEDAYRSEGNPETLRGLFIDADISILTDPKELAKIFIEADLRGLNITASYKGAAGQSYLFDMYDDKVRRMSDARLKYLYDKTDFYPLRHEIGTSGFYYGDLPRRYIWHQDHTLDEGSNFFKDQPELNVHLATKIKLAHLVNWMRSTWVDYDWKEE